LETEHPLLKIDDLLFQGTYEETVGTNLLFELNPAHQENESLPLKYVGHTTRRLVFRRVTLVPRSQPSEEKHSSQKHTQ
jgi:hypothetical protein